MSTEHDPLGRSWKLWGGILAFIVVLVVLGFLFNPKPPPTTSPPTTLPGVSPTATATTGPSATNPATTTSPAPATGDCPALSTDAAFPGTSPATQWKRHPAGMLLPVSTEHGAAIIDGNFWRCFSHTPTGSVFAGPTLLLDFVAGGIIDAAVDSADRDSLFQDAKNGPPPNEYPLFTGFRVMNSSQEKASVEYLTSVGGQYASIRVDVRWVEQAADWRMDLTNGQPQWKALNDPSGYTGWK